MHRLLLAGALALSAGAAQAAAVSVSQTLPFTVNGEDLLFQFTGLAPSNGTGGSILIEGDGDPVVYPGLDLTDSPDEFVEISFDGASQGTFNRGGDGGATVFTTVDIVAGSDCRFTQNFALSGSAFDALIADGALDVLFATSDGVSAIASEDDFVRVTLSYETEGGLDGVVPLPAALPMALAGLALLGGVARRRRR